MVWMRGYRVQSHSSCMAGRCRSEGVEKRSKAFLRRSRSKCTPGIHFSFSPPIRRIYIISLRTCRVLSSYWIPNVHTCVSFSPSLSPSFLDYPCVILACEGNTQISQFFFPPPRSPTGFALFAPKYFPPLVEWRLHPKFRIWDRECIVKDNWLSLSIAPTVYYFPSILYEFVLPSFSYILCVHVPLTLKPQKTKYHDLIFHGPAELLFLKVKELLMDSSRGRRADKKKDNL